MHIKAYGKEITGVHNGTVELASGDHLSVGYKDPAGKWHEVIISAQHLVLLINHTETDAAMIIRPGAGIQYIAPSK
jgi:hypothetical protein